MKGDKDIIIDSLMARIRELETRHDKQQKAIETLNIKNYLFGQFIFTHRDNLLNSFADFAEANYSECAYNYGYEGIEQQVIDILKDLADCTNERDKDHFNSVFSVLDNLKNKTKNSATTGEKKDR